MSTPKRYLIACEDQVRARQAVREITAHMGGDVHGDRVNCGSRTFRMVNVRSGYGRKFDFPPAGKFSFYGERFDEWLSTKALTARIAAGTL